MIDLCGSCYSRSCAQPRCSLQYSSTTCLVQNYQRNSGVAWRCSPSSSPPSSPMPPKLLKSPELDMAAALWSLSIVQGWGEPATRPPPFIQPRRTLAREAAWQGSNPDLRARAISPRPNKSPRPAHTRCLPTALTPRPDETKAARAQRPRKVQSTAMIEHAIG